MKEEIIQLLFKILDSDISKDAKEQIMLHYMLPRAKEGYPSEIIAPVEQVKKSTGKVGAIKRPTKKELDYRANPKLKEEEEAMSETLEEIGIEKNE